MVLGGMVLERSRIPMIPLDTHNVLLLLRFFLCVRLAGLVYIDVLQVLGSGKSMSNVQLIKGIL